MGLWRNKIWHYHASASHCRRKFKLNRVLAGGETCPKCGRPFLKTVECRCTGCNTTYYTDVSHNVGDRFNCPIHRELVEVTESGIVRLPDDGPQGPLRGNATWIVGISLTVGSICCLLQLINQIASSVALGVAAIASSIYATVIWAIATLTQTLPLLGWGIAGLAALVILYVLLQAFIVRPIYFFAEIYRRTQQGSDPTNDLRKLFQLPADTPSHDILKETVDKSRDTVLRQQVTIGILIIVVAVGALTCYLSVKTLERALEVLQSVVLLGSANVFGFAIIFYAGKFFFKLDEVFASRTRFLKGGILSAMFGTATVITLIVLPLVLSEYLVPGSEVAIGLTNNIIVDVFIMSYEAIASLYWKTQG